MLILKLIFWRVFIYILIGYALNRFLRVDIQRPIQKVVNAGIYVLFPVFIFVTMWAESLTGGQLVNIWLLATGVVGFGAFWAWVFSRIYKVSYGDHSLPVIFINSAYLGIPVNTYLLGSAATKFAIVFDLVPTLFMFTMGVALVAKKQKFREMLKIPLVYAALLGMILNMFMIRVPQPLLQTTGYIKALTMPLLLIIVGYEIKPFARALLYKVLTAASLRMAGGFLAAFVLVHLLKMEGIPAMVCLISSSMPSAVNSYILAKKYQSNPEFASAVVAVSTMISLPVIMIMSLLIPIKMI